MMVKNHFQYTHSQDTPTSPRDSSAPAPHENRCDHIASNLPHLFSFPTAGHDDSARTQAIQHAAKLIKNSRQIKNHDDTAAVRELDRTIDETSEKLLAWAEGAAAAASALPDGEECRARQRQVFPSGGVSLAFWLFGFWLFGNINITESLP